MTRLNDFSIFIISYMEDHGLCKNQFAKLIGVTHASVEHWVNGIANPTYETIVRMCRKLSVPVTALFPEDCLKEKKA